MTIHRIRSAELRKKGEKFESADRKRAEQRLALIQQTDPSAKLITIPASK